MFEAKWCGDVGRLSSLKTNLHKYFVNILIGQAQNSHSKNI